MIIDRYLVREVGHPFLAVSVVLAVVFLAYSLSLFLTDASSGLLTAGQVAHLTALKVLIALEVLLPIGLYVAVTLGLGRLYSDSEMAALRGAGISEFRLLKPVLRLAALLALLVGLLSVAVRPWAYDQSYALKAAAEVDSELDRLRAGRFYSYTDKQRAVFIEQTEGSLQDLRGLFVRQRRDDALQVVAAHRGRLTTFATTDHHQLVLYDAQVYRTGAKGPDLYGRFGRFGFYLPVQPPAPYDNKPKAKPTLSLLGSPLALDRAEFQWRLSTPVSTLLLAMLAVPLSRSRPRQGRFGRILIAMVAYAVYFNLVGIGRTWVEQNAVSSLWWAPGGLAVLVAIGYVPWRQLRKRYAARSKHAPA